MAPEQPRHPPPEVSVEPPSEDLDDWHLAVAAMERIRNGEERVFSLDEVERDLGLSG